MKRFLAACALAALFSACNAKHTVDAFVDAVKRINPSIVLLTMQVPGDTKASKVDDAYATGVVVASGQWGSDILTVEHAIEGAWDLHVTINNRQRVTARVLAKDTELDLALVRIPRPTLPVLALGTARLAEPGRQVALIGYPIPDQFADEGLGVASSLNEGLLSSIRRHALEVTLPIVPGESGSPVFLADTGEVIGIAESRFEQEHSIGFALPIDDAKRFLHKYDAEHGL